MHGLRDYQELVVGVLSLAGAAAAVIAVKRQIQHAEEMESERRRRRNYAARSAMPHALSSLCSYATLCTQELRRVLAENLPPNGHESVKIPADLCAPSIPNDVVSVLKECIEYGPDDVQERLASLMSHLQVQAARMNAPEEVFPNRVISASHYYRLLGDAIEIYARAAKLLDYARRKAEHAGGIPDTDDMERAARNCKFREDESPNLYRYLRKFWRPLEGSPSAAVILAS